MIQLNQITKRFPGIVANDAVDLTVLPGEIHALLGENGAGKSTLMQILYGFHAMDSGEITIDSQPVSIGSPADAIALGIGMVHQDFMLVPNFTVAENTILGLREGSSPLLNLKQTSARIRELSEQHHLAVDPNAITGTLPVGVQQRVEILKLLYRDARVLILDEPTAVLTAPEKDRLFTVLRGLRAQGRCILIVTHKLHEIMELADRVTVMRDGRNVGTLAIADTTGPELARLMVGREVNLAVDRQTLTPGPCILDVADLSVRDHAGQQKVKSISLKLHAHEIFGIAGVDGNGQSELAQALLNLRPVESGTITLHGEDISHTSVSDRRKRGLAYVPADRRGVGSVANLSIAENTMLTQPRANTRRGLLDTSLIRERASTILTRFGVRGASHEIHAAKLSGGNLQKVILGREITAAPNLPGYPPKTRHLDRSHAASSRGAVERPPHSVLVPTPPRQPEAEDKQTSSAALEVPGPSTNARHLDRSHAASTRGAVDRPPHSVPVPTPPRQPEAEDKQTSSAAPKVLIVEQPTRGLDVGAIEFIWAELLRERSAGTAILLISAELEELLNLADRIAVMYEGRFVGIVDPAQATAAQLGMMMAGTPLESGGPPA